MERLLPIPQGVKKHERLPQMKCEHCFRKPAYSRKKVKHLSMSADSSHALSNIHTQYDNWEKLASDKVILGIIKDGVTIDFHTIPRCLRAEPLCTLVPLYLVNAHKLRLVEKIYGPPLFSLERKNNTRPLSCDGEHIVANEKLIPLLPMQVINFLTSMFEMDIGHGGIASTPRALGNCVTVPGSQLG